MSKDPDESLFGPVIYSYTDDDAVSDGVLVALDKRDRVTRPVFDWLADNTPLGAKPPDGWPVEMLGWFGAIGTEAERGAKAAALAKGLIGLHGRKAREIYEKNIGGGIWKADLAPSGAPRTLWLLPNELGGMTLMFPEDY